MMNTKPTESVPEILRASAKRIRRGLWLQGKGYDQSNPAKACVINTISLVRKTSDGEIAAIRALQNALCLVDTSSVFSWNDAPGRTAEDVALALECAATIWEQDNLLPQAVAVQEQV